jgi:hypothetical protein
MSSGITGDFDELAAMIAHFDGLKHAVERALVVAAPEIQAKARSLYAAQQAADGTPWKINKNKKVPSLERPAALVTFEADGKTLVGRGEDVLQYHQDGNEKLPRRAVFPEDGDIPDTFAPILGAALKDEIEFP